MTVHQMRRAVEEGFHELRTRGWSRRAAFELAFHKVHGRWPHKEILS
jgi:hypothetical protein